MEGNVDHQRLVRRALRAGEPGVATYPVAPGRTLERVVARASPRAFDCIVLDCDRAAELARGVLRRAFHCPTIVLSSGEMRATIGRRGKRENVDVIAKAEALEADALWLRVRAAMRCWRRREAARRRRASRDHRSSRPPERNPLTNPANRSWAARGQGMHRGRRHHEGLSLVMLDVDHFRRINDAYGRSFGDIVLRALARTLWRSIRPCDSACRSSGQRFLVVRRAANYMESIAWAQDLRERVARLEWRCGGRPVRLTVSVGIVSRADGRVDTELIRRADQALRQAKDLGRNRICTWELASFDRAVRETASLAARPLEARLRGLLANCATRLGPTQREHLTSHAEYVSKMSLRLGHAMGIRGAALRRLALAGLCHDLGKFIVPEEILAKPGALSPDERLIVLAHAEYGAAMCAHLGADDETAACVRYHHARFDEDAGPDVPDRRVPLGARILAVADAFVTMTSERPYSPARSFTAALHELHRVAGTQLDPDVVEAIPAALLSDVPRGPLAKSSPR